MSLFRWLKPPAKPFCPVGAFEVGGSLFPGVYTPGQILSALWALLDARFPDQVEDKLVGHDNDAGMDRATGRAVLFCVALAGLV